MLVYDRRSVGRLLGGVGVAALTLSSGQVMAQVKGLELLVPAAPGGGWDQTARAMQPALQENGLATGIQVMNVPGAGGTIGLAQFVTGKKRRGDAIMVGGLVMLGAILTNKAPVSLSDVTPLARLTGEYEALVVPTDSPIKSMADLVAKLKAEPGSVSWGGGSAGGTDHIVAALIAKAVGVDPTKVNYVAHAGGGEALSSILGGHVTVGVSGFQEFSAQITAGKLRGLGLVAEQRLPGVDMPTLREQGVDVTLVNWRGVFAPPGIRDADLKTLSDAVGKMVQSAQWKETLTKRSWLDMYQPHDEFAAFVKNDTAQITTTLKELGLVQ